MDMETNKKHSCADCKHKHLPITADVCMQCCDPRNPGHYDFWEDKGGEEK